MAKRLAFCLSLGNLMFLRSWQELFRLRTQVPHDLATEAARSIFLATLINVLALAALLFGALRLVEWACRRWLRTLAACGFLLLLITPIDFLCRSAYDNLRADWPDPLLRGVWTAILLAPLFGCLLLVAHGNRAVMNAARAVVLVLAPLAPLAALNLGWSIFTAPVVSAKSETAPSAGRMPSRRVVWMIFDELDQRIAFDVRPESIQMPEFDRLRAVSLYATRAEAPAAYTLESMPSLITGIRVRKSRWNDGDLWLETEGGDTRALASLPNVFSQARQAGFQSAVAGWWLPYCTAFAASLTECSTPTVDQMRPGGIPGNIRLQLLDHWDLHWVRTRLRLENQWTMRHDMRATHEAVRANSRSTLLNSAIGLTLIHWPAPHPLGIWDRQTQTYALDRKNNYLDNLALADRTLGEARVLLEQSGLWESTTLIVSSDHPLRPQEWNQHATWTEEESYLSGEQMAKYVPFIVKFAGETEGFTFDREFNTVLTGNLIREVLAGRVSNARQAAAWIQHRQ